MAKATATERTNRSKERRVNAALISPPLLWLLLFFLLPIGIVALYSFGGVKLLPSDAAGVSLKGWHRLFSTHSIYLGLFWKSVKIAFTVSIIVVVLAYPVGYFLALCAPKRKYVLLLLIIAPFLTSYLLRVLAWKVILGDKGAVNSLFYWLGLRSPDNPVPWLLYSRFTVVLVLVYVWVPFVALPIFVTLENLDRSLLDAAADLGAGRWRTFTRVTLPQSLPGVVAAFIFVFIPTIGEFITPELVGGSRGFMFGNAIRDLFLEGLDWRTGSALSLFLLIVVGILIAICARFLNVRAATID